VAGTVAALGVGLGGCGFVDDPQNYPVDGSFTGRVQLDFSALRSQPIPDGCGGQLCAPDRDCQTEVRASGHSCAVYLQETLRQDIDLALALPKLSQLQASPTVKALGPVTYAFDANTLGDKAGVSTLWLAPLSDVQDRLRVKLAEIPAAPSETPATGTVDVVDGALEALTDMINNGDTQFSLVVTTELGPLSPGETPPSGQVELRLGVHLSLLGRALSSSTTGP
jgi:hypothetical protein